MHGQQPRSNLESEVMSRPQVYLNTIPLRTQAQRFVGWQEPAVEVEPAR